MIVVIKAPRGFVFGEKVFGLDVLRLVAARPRMRSLRVIAQPVFRCFVRL